MWKIIYCRCLKISLYLSFWMVDYKEKDKLCFLESVSFRFINSPFDNLTQTWKLFLSLWYWLKITLFAISFRNSGKFSNSRKYILLDSYFAPLKSIIRQFYVLSVHQPEQQTRPHMYITQLKMALPMYLPAMVFTSNRL